MTRVCFVQVIREDDRQATFYYVSIVERQDALPHNVIVEYCDDFSRAYVESVQLRGNRLVLRRRENVQTYLEAAAAAAARSREE